MRKYKLQDKEIDLDDKDYLLINAIDNLTHQIRRLANGR